MAIAVTHIKNNVVGGFHEHICSISGPASYATGGEAFDNTTINQLMPKLGGNLTPPDVAKIALLTAEVYLPGGYSCAVNRGTNKMYFTQNGAEVTAGANLASILVRCNVRYAASAAGD